MKGCLGSVSKKDAHHELERKLKANDRVYNEQFKYASNYIKTSKYNVVTFLPKNLFEQFQRLANFYFLILMILQLIPAISSLRAETTIIPLVFVLTVSGVKDLWDDLQRHRSDNQVNNRKSYVVRGLKLVEEKWQNVKVGDVIRMENDHFIAADLLLLSTSEPHGLCYIETAELDGETNLKAKQALEETAELMDDIKKIGNFDGEIACEPPNNRLNAYEGTLSWKNEKYALDNDKLLLRGCVLRNTKWCYGVVIFAGRDTKLMQNSGKTKFKRTSLDRFLNVLIIGIVIFLLSMCLICTILCGIWEQSTGQYFQAYLPWSKQITNLIHSHVGQLSFVSFLIFFSYAILLNTVVPISLYVSVEIIRFAHSWWINWDKEMYHEKSDTCAKSRTTTLNEELGQIQYIFSDKTGTLTQNVMTFNKCSINGKVYGDLFDQKGNPVQPTEDTPKVSFAFNKWHEPKFEWHDQQLLVDTRAGNNVHIDHFWKLIALCHTIMPEVKNGALEYQAQSPDEAALVSAARCFGYVFKSRTPNSITIEVGGQEITYELLCILDFNNVRKRMSVLVRSQGKLVLYCKGADTMIYERLSQNSKDTLAVKTQEHLDKFACDGLRTLCVGFKEISDEFYNSWSQRQKEASLALDGRQEKLNTVYEEIEKDLELLGATAIEDKLQDGVPEAIANLAAANIKIWVLTGDKQETAINIGYSCRLLTEDLQELFVIDGEDFVQVQSQLADIRMQIEHLAYESPVKLEASSQNGVAASSFLSSSGEPPKVLFSSNQHAGSAGEVTEEQEHLEGFALVISGHSLSHALDAQMEELFLEVACCCKAVICCRVTPLQKALVVDLVKRHKKAVTLAIGDGANDVSMIKMAHIGVGISGQEGMQAVLSSDFSIAQFKYLERLLLVHGRWSYFRMSKFLKYFFYKNFAFTLAHFWFAFFCGYSAQTIYDPVLIACYNLFFTSCPVLALGILDQDVNDHYSLRYPKLYIPGQYNLYFNMRIFVYSVLQGIVSSLVLFFIPYGAFQHALSTSGWGLQSYQVFGYTVFTGLVVAVTMQIALDTSYWTTISHVVIWGSLIFYFFLTLLYYQAITFIPVEHYGASFRALASGPFWFSIILTTIILMVPVIALRFFWFDTHPTLADRVRVRQNIKRLASRLTELPLRPYSGVSRRRGSLRSGYAFSHREGFGDLITKGIALKNWRDFAASLGSIEEEEGSSGASGSSFNFLVKKAQAAAPKASPEVLSFSSS